MPPSHAPSQAAKSPKPSFSPPAAQAFELDEQPAFPLRRALASRLQPDDIPYLQRTVGNRQVARLLESQLPTTLHPAVPAPMSLAPRVQRSPLHPALIQRKESNWSKFKNFAKGQGQGFVDDQKWWTDEMRPSTNKGVGKVAKPLFTSPFAALQLGISGIGRGLATLGAGAYYGAKGLGSGLKSLFAPDNPNQYDRERVPTRGYAAASGIKPLVAVGASAGTGLGLMGGGSPGLDSAGTAIGGGMISALGIIPALTGWAYGNKRKDQAEKSNDLAGKRVGKWTAQQGKFGLLSGLVGTAGSATTAATGIKHGTDAMMTADKLINGASYASTGLGVAGGALGIATGAITTAQGLWQSGSALGKLWKLRGGGSSEMLTARGQTWKNQVKDREKTKLMMNTLKVIGGALGVAAGGLLIASNPVGWALGIAGAVTLGGLAAYKIFTKYKKYKRKQQAKSSARGEMAQAAPPSPEEAVAGPQEGGEQGGGMEQADPSKLSEDKRKQGVELGHRIAQKASKSGKVAGEMIASLRGGNPNNIIKALSAGTKWGDLKQYDHEGDDVPRQVDLQAVDAAALLKVLNITPSEALSESGQELIEKKMSATDTL